MARIRTVLEALRIDVATPDEARDILDLKGGDNRPMTETPTPAQPRNPLHGVTLEAMVTELVAEYGWAGLDERIPLRCFAFDPSVKSSLKFLRRTPWAREKVEGLYLFVLRERRREAQSRG